MNTQKNANDQYGTFINGIIYTCVLAIILFLFCFAYKESWFDSPISFAIIGIICTIFFISGIKKVDRKKLGFLIKLGKPDFSDYYNQGIYWIFPFWKFEQKNSDFGVLNSGEEIKLNLLTSDEIPLDVIMDYWWKVKNPLTMDENFESSLIHKSIKYELTNYIQNRNSIEIFADVENSKKIITNLLEEVGETVGIIITRITPLIKFEEKYTSIVKEITYKYKELEKNLDFKNREKKLLGKTEIELKNTDIETERIQMLKLIDELKFSPQEALNYLKVYKNQVNMNENTYNIEGLNNVLEAVMFSLKNRL